MSSELGTKHRYRIGFVVGIIVGLGLLFGGLYAAQSVPMSQLDAYVLGVGVTFVLWQSTKAVGYFSQKVLNDA